MRTQTKDIQTSLTPERAFQILKDGNQRFVSNLRYNRNLLQQVNETSDGQHPFAIVLSCIDSRTSAELIFDQGLGDIFSARVAGNVLNEDVLGSMEFACQVAGAKLIVVLGHTRCGAVKGACSHVQMGHLTGLLNKISPAVYAVEHARRGRLLAATISSRRWRWRTRGSRCAPFSSAARSSSTCSTRGRWASSAGCIRWRPERSSSSISSSTSRPAQPTLSAADHLVVIG